MKILVTDRQHLVLEKQELEIKEGQRKGEKFYKAKVLDLVSKEIIEAIVSEKQYKVLENMKQYNFKNVQYSVDSYTDKNNKQVMKVSAKILDE